MALSDTDKLILVAVLAAAMAFVVFFELRYMRGKTKEVRRAAQKRDEAYNAMLTTRSVMNVMQRKGADVSSAQALVSSAKRAMDRGDFDKCMDLCEQARDELTSPPQKAEAAQPKPKVEREKEDIEEFAERLLAAKQTVAMPDSYKGTKLPVDQDSNYLSAKFEISTAKADIKKAVERGLAVDTAQGLMTDAESAFVAGSYSKALSLAVKARKAISAEAASETIPLKAEEELAEEKPTEPQVFDMHAPERACKVCGTPLEAGDVFCGKCGGKVQLEKVCSNCGTKAKPSDVFCRKCGNKMD